MASLEMAFCVSGWMERSAAITSPPWTLHVRQFEYIALCLHFHSAAGRYCVSKRQCRNQCLGFDA